MIVVLICSILSIIIAYFSSYKGKICEQLFKLSFFPITLLQMIHYDYGNDYMGYLNDHLMYYHKSFQEFRYLHSIESGSFKDMGWAVISHFFPGKAGFFILVALLSLVQNIIYCKLIQEYVEPRLRWKALAIYLFGTSYYVLNFSALRQGFTVAIAVYAIMLSCKDKIKHAIVLVLLAATIHGSVIVMLPFLFLSKFKIKDGKFFGNMIVWTTFILFISKPVVSRFYTAIMKYVPILERRYRNYAISMKATDSSVGIGFFLNLVMYLIILYFIFRKFTEFSKEYRVFMLLAVVSLMVVPFQLNITGLISRIGTYFAVYEIVVIPTLYSRIKDKYLRLGVYFIYIFMMLYAYYGFFFLTEWSAKSYRNFHTIFRAFE